MPRSTRPLLTTSRVAMREATFSGWCSGTSTTAMPSRILLVRWLMAARVMSGALE